MNDNSYIICRLTKQGAIIINNQHKDWNREFKTKVFKTSYKEGDLYKEQLHQFLADCQNYDIRHNQNICFEEIRLEESK